MWLPILCATTLSLVVQEADEEQRPNALGVVLDESGVAIRDATVFVYTAGPKVGTSPY